MPCILSSPSSVCVRVWSPALASPPAVGGLVGSQRSQLAAEEAEVVHIAAGRTDRNRSTGTDNMSEPLRTTTGADGSTRAARAPHAASSDASRLHSLPVDPAPHEWIMRDDIGDADSSAHGTRLAHLERHQPRLPKLPPVEEWNYGASSLAQKKRRDLQAAARRQEQGTEAAAATPHKRVAFEESDEKSIADDGNSAAGGDQSDDESTVGRAGLHAASPSLAHGGASAASDAGGRRARSAASDLLYGPELDAADEAWVAARHRPLSSQAAASARRTDAFLACPACFTPLCMDCQRHATRHTLFRAMFVLDGVLVDRGRPIRPTDGTDEDPNMLYWTVLCRVCKSHVGVIDNEEVYHFHHVIESQA